MEDLAFKDDEGGVILNYGGGSIQFQGLSRADIADDDIEFI